MNAHQYSLDFSDVVTRPTVQGKVVGLRGPVIFAKLPMASFGDFCTIKRPWMQPLTARIVGFQEGIVTLVPLDEPTGVSPGSPVIAGGSPLSVACGEFLLGNIVDATGKLLDGTSDGADDDQVRYSIEQEPPFSLTRRPLTERFYTGVKGIDAVCTLAYGQRIGLFAGPGVGKSSLLGTIARNASSDVTVLALVGERGREVNDFLKTSMGQDALCRTVVVVSTSDEPALRRSFAPLTATTIAEYFRDQGKRVLLLVDSLTRTARAIRDVSLAAGELPIRQGYTPSVYAQLPKLLERAGANEKGTITGIYSVLTNNDSENDPLCEEVQSLLDGHLVLSRQLAEEGMRPAIDFTISISRILEKLRTAEERTVISEIVRILSRLKHEKELVLLGGVPDSHLKKALEMEVELRRLLTETSSGNPLSDPLPAFDTFLKKSGLTGQQRPGSL